MSTLDEIDQELDDTRGSRALPVSGDRTAHKPGDGHKTQCGSTALSNCTRVSEELVTGDTDITKCQHPGCFGEKTGPSSKFDDELVQRLTMRLPTGLVEEIDAAVENGLYANRSQAIRDALVEEFVVGDRDV